MARRTTTREQRARDLIRRLERGPEFSTVPDKLFTAKEASNQYRTWYFSWINDDVLSLIPELRNYNNPGV